MKTPSVARFSVRRRANLHASLGHKRRLGLEPLEQRSLLTVTFSEFPIPSPSTSSQSITTGPDGNLWFTERNFSNAIGRITPNGVFKEFTIPTDNSAASAIARGPDGNLWFTEQDGNNVGRITPAGDITEFPISRRFSQPVAITAGPDGNMWFTENNGDRIGRITPAGDITDFSVLTGASNLNGITSGPDGNLWFVEGRGNNVGRITPDGVVTEFAIPTANSNPTGITAGPDGNLWFTESGSNKIGKISTAGDFNEFAIPTGGTFPDGIAAGPDGSLWFTESNNGNIGQITTAGNFAEFAIPSAHSFPFGISPGPDGNVWFTEGGANKIGRANLPPGPRTVNLFVGMTAPPAVLVGEEFVYNIPVRNIGAAPALGAVLTDVLPAGLQFVGNGSTGVYNESNRTFTADLGTLDPGGSTTVQIHVQATQTGTFVNTANAFINSPANPTKVASVTATNKATPTPKLDLTVQVPTDPVTNGSDFVYSIPVTNNGTDTVLSAVLSDVLPAGLQFLVNGSTGVYDEGTRTFTADLGNLAPGASFTPTIHVQATQVGTITNTAKAFIHAGTNPVQIGSASAMLDVLPALNLAFSMQASSNAVLHGDLVTFTIPVKNNAPASVGGVQVIDPLPAGLTFVSADPVWDGTSFGTRSIGGRVVSDLGRLDSGQTLNVKITARAAQAGTFTNTAYGFGNKSDLTGASSDISKAPYSASADVQVSPAADLSITGTVAEDNAAGVNLGATIAYSFKIKNDGPDTAKHVIFLDQFPANVTFTPASVDPDNADAFVIFNPSGPTGIFNVDSSGALADLGDIPSGKSATVFLSVKNSDLNVVVNSASVGLAAINGVDPNLTNNALIKPLKANLAPVSLQTVPNLGGTSAGAPGTSSAEDPVGISNGGNFHLLQINKASQSYWTLSNTGLTTATGLEMTIRVPNDVLVSGATYDSSSDVTGSAEIFTTALGSTLDFKPGDLAPGKSAVMTYSITGSFVGEFIQSANVTADEPLTGGGALTGIDYDQVRSTISGRLTYHNDNGPSSHSPVLSKVDVASIFYGKQWDTAANQTFLTDTNKFLKKIVDSPYMDFLSPQYDTPYQTIGRGTMDATETLDSANAPVPLTDAQIQGIIATEITNGNVTNPTDRLVFFYTAPGTIVTRTDGGNSAGTGTNGKNFYAYHGSFQLGGPGGGTVYYVAMPYEASPNSSKGKLKTFPSMTNVASHELAEAVTDPGGGTTGQAAWFDKYGGSEVGDLPNLQNLQNEPEGVAGDYGTLDGYVVQYEFANFYTYPGTNFFISYDAALPSEPPGAGGLSLSTLVSPTSPAPGGSFLPRGALPPFSYSGPIATFTDDSHPGSDPANYQVDIDWGDGNTTPGTVTFDTGSKQFVATGTHTFSQAAGTTADLTLTVTNTVTGEAAGLERKVTLTQATAPPGTIQFDEPTYEVYRNGSDATIVVDRTGDTTVGATVHYAASAGTAINGSDFQAESGTLEFAPGQTFQAFSLPIYADPTVTTDRTVNLVLSFPTGNDQLGSPATATLTIHRSNKVFAPNPPTLDPVSDTGASNADAATTHDGSAQAPLTFDIADASIPNGFVQLFDVTNPAIPVALGSPAQASNGKATVTLQSTGMSTGMHLIAVASAATATSAWSPVSTPLSLIIDTVAPSSAVNPLPATTTTNDFKVSWTGDDNVDGSGIARFDVFVADNGGPFTAFQAGTSSNSATFTGLDGHSYAFYSVANDVAGNVEPTPATSQTVTLIHAPAVLQFAISQFNANVTDGTAKVVVTRAGNPLASVSVMLSSPGGRGVAAFQKTITFDPNAASQEVTIPIVNNGKPGESDSQISFSLSSAGTGATLGATTSANLVIHDTNPFPKPVIVTSVVTKTITVGTGRKAKKQLAVVLQLSGALDAGSAQNASAYHLLSGKTKKNVTTYSKPVQPTSASYDALSKQITLVPAGKLNLASPMQLRITNSLVNDTFGRPLDGNHDGQPGGDFAANLTKGRFSILSVERGSKIHALNAAAVDHHLAHHRNRGDLTARPSY